MRTVYQLDDLPLGRVYTKLVEKLLDMIQKTLDGNIGKIYIGESKYQYDIKPNKDRLSFWLIIDISPEQTVTLKYGKSYKHNLTILDMSVITEGSIRAYSNEGEIYEHIFEIVGYKALMKKIFNDLYKHSKGWS